MVEATLARGGSVPAVTCARDAPDDVCIDLTATSHSPTWTSSPDLRAGLQTLGYRLDTIQLT